MDQLVVGEDDARPLLDRGATPPKVRVHNMLRAVRLVVHEEIARFFSNKFNVAADNVLGVAVVVQDDGYDILIVAVDVPHTLVRLARLEEDALRFAHHLEWARQEERWPAERCQHWGRGAQNGLHHRAGSLLEIPAFLKRVDGAKAHCCCRACGWAFARHHRERGRRPARRIFGRGEFGRRCSIPYPLRSEIDVGVRTEALRLGEVHIRVNDHCVLRHNAYSLRIAYSVQARSDLIVHCGGEQVVAVETVDRIPGPHGPGWKREVPRRECRHGKRRVGKNGQVAVPILPLLVVVLLRGEQVRRSQRLVPKVDVPSGTLQARELWPEPFGGPMVGPVWLDAPAARLGHDRRREFGPRSQGSPRPLCPLHVQPILRVHLRVVGDSVRGRQLGWALVQRNPACEDFRIPSGRVSASE
mmetsp:Transcript_1766/g.4479  ORF Transcript_1766/g.4479 Transcript_1766/m.4479 type:complete len:414 (-) Transcript_1766:172-1413(-)